MAQDGIRSPNPSKAFTAEIRPDTIADFIAIISKQYGLPDQLKWPTQGEPRDMKDWASQRDMTAYQKPTTFHCGDIPEGRPVEPEAPTGTSQHNLSIHSNIAKEKGKQGNRISNPGSHAGSVTATISGNTCEGNGDQQNHIG